MQRRKIDPVITFSESGKRGQVSCPVLSPFRACSPTKASPSVARLPQPGSGCVLSAHVPDFSRRSCNHPCKLAVPSQRSQSETQKATSPETPVSSHLKTGPRRISDCLRQRALRIEACRSASRCSTTTRTIRASASTGLIADRGQSYRSGWCRSRALGLRHRLRRPRSTPPDGMGNANIRPTRFNSGVRSMTSGSTVEKPSSHLLARTPPVRGWRNIVRFGCGLPETV